MLKRMRVAWFGLFLSATLALAAAPCAGAEPPKPAPAGEVVRGELVAKSETSLDVQQEDEPQVSHCPLFPAGFTVKLDAKYQAFLRDLAIGSEVQLLLANEPTGRRRQPPGFCGAVMRPWATNHSTASRQASSDV